MTIKALAQLAEYPHWVCWRYETRNDGKKTKPPYNAKTGDYAKPNDPATWSTYDEALARAQNYDGIGFALEPARVELVGIDLDDCVDEAGQVEPWARRIVDQVESYTEISPSGRGLRIFTFGALPKGRRRKGKIEMYDRGRYLTVTGNHLAGTPETIEARDLAGLHRQIFGQAKSQAQRQAAPAGDDDQALLARACSAANGDKFNQLWHGTYPEKDQSRLDFMLAESLNFWTKGDKARIRRLMLQSALVRDKWLEKHAGDGRDYLELTIDNAMSFKHRDESRVNGKGSFMGAAAILATEPAARPVNEAETPKRKHKSTDLGNARRLVELFGQDICYVKAWDKWYLWDGTRWADDELNQVERLAKEVPMAIYREALEADDELRPKLMKWGATTENAGRISAMIRLAQSEGPVAIRYRDLNNNPMLFNVKNGTIDLITGELLPHNRDDLVTKRADIDYDAGAGCPLWLSFLNRVLNQDAELIEFLQRAIGYTLTGDVSEQCLFFLYGTGHNGKSVFSETLKTLFGDYGLKAPTDMLMLSRNNGIPNDIARLPGARFVIAAEIEEGRYLAESQVKDLTGGDTIVARFLHQEFFEFEPSHKLWMYGNHKPNVRGTDYAIWRRIKLIPFEVTIPENERDQQLTKKLKVELPGILRWAVEGCLKWRKTGLAAPKVVTHATDQYRAEMDVLGDFIEEQCLTEKNMSVKASAIFKAFDNWCNDNNERSIKRRDFKARMIERGFTYDKYAGYPTYYGIGLLQTETNEQPQKRESVEI